MKLLIIAGPYEADRIRRAAVSAGVETVAVEPGESLSGWITASRPDVIVLAPQMVAPDAAAAVAKVRAVSRGRGPIFLLGDADEEAVLRPLGDGFFARPVDSETLVAAARAAFAALPRPLERESGSGPHGNFGEDGQPAVVSKVGSGPHSGKTPTLKPLVPKPETPSASRALFDQLADSIDADFDAEIREVARTVEALRDRPAPADGAPPDPDVEDGAVAEMREESSQKTLEVPEVVSTALAEGEEIAVPPLGNGAAAKARKGKGKGKGEGEGEGEGEKNGEEAEDEGELELPALLARVYLSRLSGRLTLRQGAVEKHVVLERGHPVLAGSTRAEDRLGAMLVRQGRLSAAEAEAAGDMAASTGRRLGAVLVAEGKLDAAELPALVRAHQEEIISSLFAWERGAWSLSHDDSVAEEAILLSRHPTSLILDGIRRHYAAARSLAALDAAGGAPAGGRRFRLRATVGLSDLLDAMAMEPDDRKLVLLFDGVRSLDQLGAAVGEPAVAQRLYGIAWALRALDRLDVVDEGGAVAESAAAGGRPRGPAERDERIDRARVEARFALVEDGDYFQILGVRREATGDEIRLAHELLVADFGPEGVHPVVIAERERELHAIRAVLDEAARLLADDGLRDRYRAHLS